MLSEDRDIHCSVCGREMQWDFTEISHFRPKGKRVVFDWDNLVAVCEKCNVHAREFEFASFLAELMARSSSFRGVKREVLLGSEVRYRADIVAVEAGVGKNLLIECKGAPHFSVGWVRQIIKQLRLYQDAFGECQMILATPATLLDEHRAILQGEGVEVWDLDFLVKRFRDQIPEANSSYYKELFSSYISRRREASREYQLIRSLSDCAFGKKDCYVYQSLVGDILEYLFSPPLDKPIAELSDQSKANRRDFIIPNYMDSGFWAFMREKYSADYIVVDAKNYTRKVKKQEVLQMANYLKGHGAGLFGIIVSRLGGDAAGCEHTLREQWLIHKKLILVLDDDDVKSMLMAKADGRPPEEVLGQKIERFRLSM
ncbi:HNH endonuclease [Pseudomonas sp. BN515]|uniref:HNH endonuclease n=1 Tax=Pseudomonas sp. BN515 TaxID=2567892 RepID=UPI0024585A04|nr:HNH endonuclease [Pseudomonas sp. BN515]MDH4870583.1 HNH endonuclease [Pseudomonas sp. BN515]